MEGNFGQSAGCEVIVRGIWIRNRSAAETKGMRDAEWHRHRRRNLNFSSLSVNRCNVLGIDGDHIGDIAGPPQWQLRSPNGYISVQGLLCPPGHLFGSLPVLKPMFMISST